MAEVWQLKVLSSNFSWQTASEAIAVFASIAIQVNQLQATAFASLAVAAN